MTRERCGTGCKSLGWGYCRNLVESQAPERNRLLKLLETANIKLASVASDVFGVSGRALLKALIEGSASAEAIADLADGNCAVSGTIWFWRSKGGWEEHHRFLLAAQLPVSKRRAGYRRTAGAMLVGAAISAARAEGSYSQTPTRLAATHFSPAQQLP
jgi:hypothetical protein